MITCTLLSVARTGETFAFHVEFVSEQFGVTPEVRTIEKADRTRAQIRQEYRDWRSERIRVHEEAEDWAVQLYNELK